MTWQPGRGCQKIVKKILLFSNVLRIIKAEHGTVQWKIQYAFYSSPGLQSTQLHVMPTFPSQLFRAASAFVPIVNAHCVSPDLFIIPEKICRVSIWWKSLTGDRVFSFMESIFVLKHQCRLSRKKITTLNIPCDVFCYDGSRWLQSSPVGYITLKCILVWHHTTMSPPSWVW